MSSLDKILAEVQDEVGTVVKRGVNPHFKSSYATLNDIVEQVTPVLRKHHLAIHQYPDMSAGCDVLVTRIVNMENGDKQMGMLRLHLAKDDPQAMGSALTYARRYSLVTMLGLLADEDDDGNAASGKPAEKNPTSRTRRVAPATVVPQVTPLDKVKEAFPGAVEESGDGAALSSPPPASNGKAANPISLKQMGLIRSSLKDHGITAKDDVNSFVGGALKREVTSLYQVDTSEMDTVVKAMEVLS